MKWCDMTPKQRCDLIASRMRKQHARAKMPWYFRNQELHKLNQRLRYRSNREHYKRKKRVQKARTRRALLRADLHRWMKSVVDARGDIAVVARTMRRTPHFAERALWDLGLWPLVIMCRKEHDNA